MCEEFSAVFEERNGEIEVFYVHDRSGNSTYLGTLDPAEDDDIYEGRYVFNLAAGYLVRHDAELLHIPVNVLREIADYGSAPKVCEEEYLDPFTGTWKKVENPRL